jgi:prolyl 4-hydroxylase
MQPDIKKLHPLNINPLVAGMGDFIDADQAQEIIHSGESRLAPSTVWDEGAQKFVINNAIRSAKTCALMPSECTVVASAQTRLAEILALPAENCETPWLLRYEAGQEYKAHCDAVVPNTDNAIRDLQARGQRFFTCLLYLNHDFEGGNTSFPSLGLSIKPVTGRLLIWSNAMLGSSSVDPRSVHIGEPVTSGVKYALTFWFRQPPQKGQFFNVHPDQTSYADMPG